MKTCIKSSMPIDIPALEYFANGDQGPARITAECVKKAVVSVDANKGDMFELSDIGKHQVHTFPNNKSTLLKLLAPTERAYEQHLKRAALATSIDKSAQICKPSVEPCEDYGWAVDNDEYFMAGQSTRQSWP